LHPIWLIEGPICSAAPIKNKSEIISKVPQFSFPNIESCANFNPDGFTIPKSTTIKI
jgi:hypothetical protein